MCTAQKFNLIELQFELNWHYSSMNWNDWSEFAEFELKEIQNT